LVNVHNLFFVAIVFGVKATILFCFRRDLRVCGSFYPYNKKSTRIWIALPALAFSLSPFEEVGVFLDCFGSASQ
jgi:hypothetical protein